MTQQIQTKQLHEVALIQSGFAFHSNDFSKQGIPIIRISNITQGNEVEILDKDQPFYPFSIDEKISKFLLKKEDILIALSGATTGKIGIYKRDKPALLNQRIALVRAKDKKSNEYIYYFLQTKSQQILKEAYGGAQPNISPKNLEVYEIYYPDENQRTLIVQEIKKQFTRLDEAVKSLKSVKQKLEIYRKAVLKKAFERKKGWEASTIGKEVKVKYGKGLPERTREKGNIPVYGSAGKVGTHNIYLINFPTIIVARKGSIGNNFIVKEPCWAIDTVYYLKDIKLNLDYLFHYLNLSIFKDTSTAVPSLRREDLEAIKINFPVSISEQRFIVQSIESKFSVIDKIEQVIEASLEKAEKLRKSILKSAFEGKLVKMGEMRE